MNAAQLEAIAVAEAHLNNAGLALAIYTVFCFPIQDGRRRMEMHYAAGFSSWDAERRYKENCGQCLVGQCYITTDPHVEQDQAAVCKNYVTRWKTDDNISDADHRNWVKHMTHESDGYPAALRRIHADSVKKKAGEETFGEVALW